MEKDITERIIELQTMIIIRKRYLEQLEKENIYEIRKEEIEKVIFGINRDEKRLQENYELLEQM